ncbi:MAG: malto-oligosyltrehalose trehalohydrolase [Rhodospirillaceae bacterium]|nr:malto-oligosyltrehalose trehalohydrolase [Rhodospirillaceae bacterium]
MSASYAHTLPFGAEVVGDGAVRFRLWAPAQTAPVVVLEDGGEFPMAAAGDGYFEAAVPAAHGSAYRYRLDNGFLVPDPASRAQGDDAHGPSLVVDPRRHAWQDGGWRGRPWEEAVLYELHVGTFTQEGTFDAVRRKLDHLVRLGITAVELMPVADFPGRRGWGYDGVLHFAPDRAYGTPDTLKTLVEEAHARGLMIFLDVVYNHFGPDGNYLHLYAPQFFTDRHVTPWGAAIDFSQRAVRDFYIHNALYWLQEYRFDGLRFDAVHAIVDESPVHILTELAEAVRATVRDRYVHLVLENDSNESRFLSRDDVGRPRHYDAQWNDDAHHVFHVLATGEAGGYYQDYVANARDRLARVLTEGFAYQGEASDYRAGELRGEPSGHLPPSSFVNFTQNHDQVGNRAFGDRLARIAPAEAVRATAAVLLLAPPVPMLFMGEEWGSAQPFLYFCDFHDDLAAAVRDGRRREFAQFPEFADPQSRTAIPDPNADATFAASRLDWPTASMAEQQAWLALYARLLKIRREFIVPRLSRIKPGTAVPQAWDAHGLTVRWPVPEKAQLVLVANLSAAPQHGCGEIPGRLLYESHPGLLGEAAQHGMPPWSVVWSIIERSGW